MNVLASIIAAKLKEVAVRKANVPVPLLERSAYFERQCFSMKGGLDEKSSNGIIAEFKRKSPSQSWINQSADAGVISSAYVRAGAVALSVLTDEPFFGAQQGDFLSVRSQNTCPMLRKDFIIDEYQVLESKSMGADVILLLAKVLSPQRIEAYTRLAHQLGMEVLLELHNEEEVRNNAFAKADMLGINNRNLKDFTVDFENSARLAALLPADKLKVAESGISKAADIDYLRRVGFKGFLVGEQFMRYPDPGFACSDLIKKVNYEN